jgi:hypothetical protein
MCKKRLSSDRQCHIPGGPSAKLDAEFLFQLFQRIRQARLDDVHALCCSGEALLFGQSNKELQLPYFHSSRPSPRIDPV